MKVGGQLVYSELDELIEKLTEKNIIPAVSVAIGHKGNIIYSNSSGIISESGNRITNESRFDIASMTKILTGICFMKFIEKKLIGLYDPICNFFSEFNTKKPIEKNGVTIGWCDASKVTWYHVLTHTSGMGWTRPKTRPSLPNLNKGLEDIFRLPFAYQTGEHIIYSDIPIILMGIVMERISGKKLDELIKNEVCIPLKLNHTGFRRISNCLSSRKDIVPTENDTLFRKRRIWGEVHDENAFLLDGVAAHAGIFSTAEDMCTLAMAYAHCLEYDDGILKNETVKMMINENEEEEGDRRGLMWQLSGSGKNAYTRFLSSKAYGHAGFTGCFLWNDPEKDLSIVFLSNDVYNGRDNRKLFEYRPQIMKCITDINCLEK